MNANVEKQTQDTPVTREKTYEGPTFAPAVDIIETPHAFTIIADMPGADPNAITIQFEDTVLTIHAATCREGELQPMYSEYESGEYERSFTVSHEIEVEKIEAAYKNGVLTLSLPKSAAAQPRKIKVKTD
jgi:HSP20 family protein